MAEVEDKEATASKKVIFTTPEDYDVARFLPPPPAPDSDLAKAELFELHRIEDARTPAQEEQARSDTKTKDASIFAAVMGTGFDLKALPATAKLFADVRNDEKIAAADAKDYFKRNRPWIVDPSLKSCSRHDEAQTSYPSGHATMGYTMGVVLASLAPEKAQAILARSAVYAENRLECGVHFRSDIVAGQVLGTVLAERMMMKPKFKVEYAAAAKELAAAHLIAKAPR
jgi:acid phosphatase (class A)